MVSHGILMLWCIFPSADMRPTQLQNPMGDVTKAYVKMAVRSARSPSTDNLADMSECTIALYCACLAFGLPFLLLETSGIAHLSCACMCAPGRYVYFKKMMAPFRSLCSFRMSPNHSAFSVLSQVLLYACRWQEGPWREAQLCGRAPVSRAGEEALAALGGCARCTLPRPPFPLPQADA